MVASGITNMFDITVSRWGKIGGREDGGAAVASVPALMRLLLALVSPVKFEDALCSGNAGGNIGNVPLTLRADPLATRGRFTLSSTSLPVTAQVVGRI